MYSIYKRPCVSVLPKCCMLHTKLQTMLMAGTANEKYPETSFLDMTEKLIDVRCLK